MKNPTMIRVSKQTRDKLKAIKIVPRESYDDLLLRIIPEKEKVK